MYSSRVHWVVVWAGRRMTGWWRSGVTATTVHLIVLTHWHTLSLPGQEWIILVSSKEFGALEGDGWPRIDGWQIEWSDGSLGAGEEC